jgi:hypothetical protein
MPLFRLPGLKLASCHWQGDRPCCTARPICHLVAKDQSAGGIRRPDGIGTRDASQGLVHIWSTCHWIRAVRSGLQRYVVRAGRRCNPAEHARVQNLIRMRSLISRASLRYPVSRAGAGAFCLLDFRRRICYGARGQDGFRDATREEERRRAPHLREVVPIGSPCEQRRTRWGRSASTSPPAPGRSAPVVPFARHTGRTTPVPSGQPRSLSSADELAVSPSSRLKRIP